jgi:hypothetical protein
MPKNDEPTVLECHSKVKISKLKLKMKVLPQTVTTPMFPGGLNGLITGTTMSIISEISMPVEESAKTAKDESPATIKKPTNSIDKLL